MFRSIINNTSKNVSAGGTLSGDVVIDGDLTVNGDSAANISETITGDMTITSSSSNHPIFTLENSNNDDSPAFITFKKSNSGSANDGDEVGQFQYQAYNDAGTPELTTYADHYVSTDDVSDGSEDGSMTFRTMKAGTLTSTLVLQSGNIGIGTASPERTVHIMTSDASLASSDANVGLLIEENDHTYIELLTPADKNSGIIFSDGSTAGLINYDHGSNAMTFGTNDGATDVTINSSGNVGIGGSPVATWSPNQTITTASGSQSSALVLANTNTGLANNYTVGVIEAQAGAGNRIAAIRFRTQGTDENSGDITLETGSAGTAAERVRITSAGNVGIGTSSPDFNLSIESTGDTITNIDSYSDTTSNVPVLKFRKSHNDTLGTITQTTDGHYLGFIGFEGVNSSSAFARGAGIFATQNGSSGSSIVPAKLHFQANSNSAALTAMILDENSRISLSNNDDGTGNTVFGYAAGAAIANGGNYNVAVGHGAAVALTTGVNNVAIGKDALVQGTTETDDNVAIGYNAMSGAIGTEQVNDCVAIGSNALAGALDSTNGVDESSGTVAIGANSLTALTSGASNLAIGYDAGKTITTTSGNTIVGSGTATAGTIGANNTVVGHDAFNANISGAASCVVIGKSALAAAHTQTGTVAIGASALGACTSGAGNTAIGYQALDAEDEGNRSTAVGHQALSAQNNDTGSNTAVGWSAGDLIVAGYANTLIGAESGTTGTNDLTSGYQNTLIGQATAASAAGAIAQTVVGRGAMGNQDYGTVIGNTSMFQFASKQYTAHYADGEDLKSASAGAGLKLPAYSIIKSISVVVTQLSNLGTYNICLVLADDGSGVADNSAFTNPVEVLGAGVAATLSGNSSSAVDIALGSGAVVKQSYHMDEAINVGTSDKYLHLAQAGTGNGDTNPSTNALLNVMVEYIGLD